MINSKIQGIRDSETENLKKLQSNKHTNKKSKYLVKYYVPIHKRLDTEIQQRKAKLAELTNRVAEEREMKEKQNLEELHFPRTQLSYEVQRKHSTNQRSQHNLDIQADDNANTKMSCREMFQNFMKDHQTWQYKRDKKIADQKEKKQAKISETLTFRPQINNRSIELVPKRTGKIENRLINEGQKLDQKLRQIYESHTYAFQPNIYRRNHTRSHSVLGSHYITPFTKKPEGVPPLPPRTNQDLKRHKIEISRDQQVIKNDIDRQKHRIRGFSPVLQECNPSYNTLSPQK